MSRRTLLLCLLAVSMAGCKGESGGRYSGYFEGDYVRVAAPFGGELTQLPVQRGDRVEAGTPLFALEQENEKALRAEAQARLRQAQARLADLQKGKRPQELEAIRAQLAQAQANWRLSQAELKRTQELLASGFISEARVDEARAAEQRDQARVRQLQADVSVARLSARPDEIAAAQAEVKAADDTLAQADWRLRQKSQTAPQSALVADTLYQQGEWVPAGAPVVALLPAQNIKARFFVPEAEVGALRIGQAIRIYCDGCPAPIDASISFVSPRAEYTPPVIYSRESRSKLVFMVEARPSSPEADRLHPGQPVEAELVDRRIAMER